MPKKVSPAKTKKHWVEIDCSRVVGIVRVESVAPITIKGVKKNG